MVAPLKYPSTGHLPFSLSVYKDDKYCPNVTSFINKTVIITEKLDGGNCNIIDGKVYARSNATPTICPSFDYIKGNYLHRVSDIIHRKKNFFGENMYAIHSIEYDKLDFYLYIFAILDSGIWLRWEEIENICDFVGFKTVPVLYTGRFKKIEEIEEWMTAELKTPSVYGKEKEGFVIRIADSFPFEDFNKNVAKFVRLNHVQTDIHWSKNWKPHKLIDSVGP